MSQQPQAQDTKPDQTHPRGRGRGGRGGSRQNDRRDNQKPQQDGAENQHHDDDQKPRQDGERRGRGGSKPQGEFKGERDPRPFNYQPGQPIPKRERPDERPIQKIQLRRNKRDIILIDSEKAEFDKIDEEIKKLQEQPDPDRKSLDAEIIKIDREIQRIRDIANSKNEQIKKLKEDNQRMHEEKPKSEELRLAREAKKAAQDAKAEQEPTFTALKSKYAELNSLYREQKDKLGVASTIDLSKTRIEELENDIEVNTYSNQILKKKLAEIDHLKQNQAGLGEFAALKDQRDSVKKQLDELSPIWKALLIKANETKDHYKQLDEIQNPMYKKIEANKEKIKSLYEEIKAENAKIPELNQSRREKILAFFRDYRQWEKKARNIEYHQMRQMRIYQEAEHRMYLEERKAKEDAEKAEEKKAAIRNPNEKQLRAAQALIGYLKSQQGIVPTDAEQSAAQGGKAASAQDMALIGTLRQEKKAKRTKKQDSAIIHSMETLGQFAFVGVTAPKDKASIPATIVALKEKKHQWKAWVPPPEDEVETPAPAPATETPAQE